MEIFYTKLAHKSIKNLDAVMRHRIKNGIEQIPTGDIKKLQGYSNIFWLRIGDYRILFEMSSETVIIYDVLPRGEAYKNI